MPHPTRIFKEPEEMLTAWKNYKKSLKEESKQWEKVQYVGKDGIRKTDYPKIPLTLEGFKRWCREQKKLGEVEHYFSNTEGYYDDFCGICSHIREEIREDQIKGGLLGFYNPSITQRLNGLTEKVKTEHSGSLNIPNLPDIGDRK